LIAILLITSYVILKAVGVEKQILLKSIQIEIQTYTHFKSIWNTFQTFLRVNKKNSSII